MEKSQKQTKNDMSNKDLETKIHDLIRKLYKAKYNGTLEVTNKNGIYVLKLGVPTPELATQISLQTDSEEEFLEYLEKELKDRDYMRVYYYKVKRTENEKKKWDTINKKRAK